MAFYFDLGFYYCFARAQTTTIGQLTKFWFVLSWNIPKYWGRLYIPVIFHTSFKVYFIVVPSCCRLIHLGRERERYGWGNGKTEEEWNRIQMKYESWQWCRILPSILEYSRLAKNLAWLSGLFVFVTNWGII